MLTTQARPRLEAFPLRRTHGIQSLRGMHLKPGDTVCFADGTEYRILTVAPDRPLTVAGEWEIVDRRARVLKRPEWRTRSFRLYQDKFYCILRRKG